MAGILKVDTLQSDSNLALKIATANVAFIDSNGLNVVGGNLTIGATQFAEGGQVQTAGIADGAVTNDKIVSVANTKLSGVIVASQLASTLDLTGKTVTLPAGVGGKVLKVSTYENNTYTEVTSSGFTTVWTFSYTPTASGNLLIIQISPEIFTYRSGGADARYSARVLVDSTYYPGETNTFVNNGFYDYGSSGGQTGTKQFYQFYYTTTSTSAFNISLQFAANGQTQGVRLNNSASGVSINQCSTAVVTEIAA